MQISSVITGGGGDGGGGGHCATGSRATAALRGTAIAPPATPVAASMSASLPACVSLQLPALLTPLVARIWGALLANSACQKGVQISRVALRAPRVAFTRLVLLALHTQACKAPCDLLVVVGDWCAPRRKRVAPLWRGLCAAHVLTHWRFLAGAPKRTLFFADASETGRQRERPI